jgi:hypothetical protein
LGDPVDAPATDAEPVAAVVAGELEAVMLLLDEHAVIAASKANTPAPPTSHFVLIILT